METKETKKCPYCGQEILAVAVKCKHCRKWLPKEDEQPKEIPSEKPQEAAPIEPEAAPHQELAVPSPAEQQTDSPSLETVEEKPQEPNIEEVPPTPEKPRDNKSKRKYLVFAAVGVVLLLGLIWLFIPQDDVAKADKLRLENKFEESTALYQKAAQEGNAYAMWRFSQACSNGDGIEFNDPRALEWLQKAIANGSEEAKVDMAFANLFGWYNLPIDSTKGVSQIKDLINTSDNPYVLYRCARLYTNGYGDLISIDNEEAYKITQKIKDKDNPYYNHMMGYLYQYGSSSITVDEKKALELQEKALEKGVKDAALFAASIYCVGTQTPKDYLKAIEWLNKGVEKNSTPCMLYLAWIYDSENPDTKNLHNDQKVNDLYKKAMSHGNADAYSRLGYSYTIGSCVEKDDQKAFELYKKSAELGSVDGMVNVGVNYLVGRGTDKDVKAAEKMWIEAANRGSAEAAWRLSECYREGTVEGNVGQYKQYLAKAANLGHAAACCKLGTYYFSGVEGLYPKDAYQSFIYMKKAADAGYFDAYAVMAYFYENGMGCEKDPEKAKEYKVKAGINN